MKAAIANDSSGPYEYIIRYVHTTIAADSVIPPFFGALKSRGHAACAKRCFGV